MPFLEWFPGSSREVPGGLPRGVSRWFLNSAHVISRGVPGQFLRWGPEGLLWWFLGSFREVPGVAFWVVPGQIPERVPRRF